MNLNFKQIFILNLATLSLYFLGILIFAFMTYYAQPQAFNPFVYLPFILPGMIVGVFYGYKYKEKVTNFNLFKIILSFAITLIILAFFITLTLKFTSIDFEYLLPKQETYRTLITFAANLVILAISMLFGNWLYFIFRKNK